MSPTETNEPSKDLKRAGSELEPSPSASRWAIRVLVAVVLAAVVASLPIEFYGEKGFRHYLQLKRELAQLKERNGRLQEEAERMHREIDALRNDDRTLERVARDELGLIKDSEIVFVVLKRSWP